MEKKGKDTIENRRHASKKWRTKKIERNMKNMVIILLFSKETIRYVLV